MKTKQPKTHQHVKQQLLLFMSVDLAGSTAFKNKTVAETIQPWLKVFVDFYREFPTVLHSYYLQSQAGKVKGSSKPPTAPELWKAIGDELVFVARITNHAEIPAHLNHFRETIRSYREIVQDADKKLDLKATAWVAGFPVYNSIILLPEGKPDDGYREDYIGPSIDTGFRLGKLASPRRFVLSLELAYLLASMQADAVKEFQFYYDGGAELKGVLSGYPYPVVWTDLHRASPLETAEDNLQSENHEVKPVVRDKLHRFLVELIKKIGSPIYAPFIEGDTAFPKKTDDYDNSYQKICKVWDDIYEKQLDTKKRKKTTPSEPLKSFLTETASEMSKQFPSASTGYRQAKPKSKQKSG